jgi:hypothetical protein
MFEITIANADDRSKQTELTLPTTSAQVRDAFSRIGLDGKQHQEYAIVGHRMTADGLLDCLQPNDRIDDLNYLADRLNQLDDAELAKLAAVVDGRDDLTVPAVIDLTYNLDYYVHIPDVPNFEELGRYYLYQSGMVEMPETWKSAIPLEAFGKNAAAQEHGRFTEHGYLLKSGDEWVQHYNGESIPEKYRVTSYPNQQEIRFSIYQLRQDEDTRPLRWQSFDDLIASGQIPKLEDYRLVYSGVMYPGETMETIFEKFNLNRPEDFTSHSLSVSDVVVVEQDARSTAHYVDNFGFQQLDGFLLKEPEREKPSNENPSKKRHRDYGPEL